MRKHTLSEIRKYITKRIDVIEAEEKELTDEDYDGMTFSADDVVQELLWILERIVGYKIETKEERLERLKEEKVTFT